MPFRSLQVVLIVLSLNASAQTLPAILSTNEYKSGLYKNYSEFLNNSPSTGEPFTYKTYSSESQIEDDKASYKLILIDSAYSKRDLKKIWGFCDGKSIFVNEFAISGKLLFRKLQGVGRYCYLMATPLQEHVYTPYLIDGLVASAIVNAAKGLEPFVLNINNGKYFHLDKSVLTTILQRDRALLTEYESAEKKRKDNTLLEYIARYNERHADEADASLWFDRDLIVYRFDKRELAAPITLRVNDTLDVDLRPAQSQRLLVQGEKVKLCLQDGSCTEVELVRKGATFVSLSQRKEDKIIIRQTQSAEAKPFLDAEK